MINSTEVEVGGGRWLEDHGVNLPDGWRILVVPKDDTYECVDWERHVVEIGDGPDLLEWAEHACAHVRLHGSDPDADTFTELQEREAAQVASLVETARTAPEAGIHKGWAEGPSNVWHCPTWCTVPPEYHAIDDPRPGNGWLHTHPVWVVAAGAVEAQHYEPTDGSAVVAGVWLRLETDEALTAAEARSVAAALLQAADLVDLVVPAPNFLDD